MRIISSDEATIDDALREQVPANLPHSIVLSGA
jgi:hypothetical protein